MRANPFLSFQQRHYVGLARVLASQKPAKGMGDDWHKQWEDTVIGFADALGVRSEFKRGKFLEACGFSQ